MTQEVKKIFSPFFWLAQTELIDGLESEAFSSDRKSNFYFSGRSFKAVTINICKPSSKLCLIKKNHHFGMKNPAEKSSPGQKSWLIETDPHQLNPKHHFSSKPACFENSKFSVTKTGLFY